MIASPNLPQKPPTVGELEIAPGCTAATMPRRRGVLEHTVDAQPFAVLIYTRAERVLLEPPAPSLTKRRTPARSVSFLPAGLATRWLYASPIFDGDRRLSALHLRFTREFESALGLGPNQSLHQPSAELDLKVKGLPRLMEAALRAYESREPMRQVALQSAVFAAAERLFQGSVGSGLASTFTEARRRALTEHVESTPTDEITVLGMADVVGLSASHFLKVFKAATGQTPYRWALARRAQAQGGGEA